MPSIIKLNIKHNFFPISCGSVTLIKRNNPGLVSGKHKTLRVELVPDRHSYIKGRNSTTRKIRLTKKALKKYS